MLAAAHLPPHEARRLEDTDVARYPGECHRQRRGKVGDAGVALTQRLQKPSPGRIGERGVRAVQHLIFNHLVDYNGRP